ncbi:LodA/GoxA family CTQ-dependent oxidase [uncultured Tateyamaria sp.]|uniref:LodA/GoxA family CTQ-dependent oxidase n=1 Tax=uncultured Tateyamaria sp. TaxID=455651 RepID=UPI00263156D7|nr:LodA/GoxA family CTQ-dependent oxidase [uncultured Tateyamaria sp.]
MNADDIESISIHPAIGVARVGNAEDGYFLAPEVVGATPNDTDGFRDEHGRMKRQVARFRIYATLKSGEVREVTASDADINWRVEIANLKAGWYDFQHAMDLPPDQVFEPPKRNATFNGDDRARLSIRPTARHVSGPNQVSAPFDDGTFFDKPVYLGELRTDASGRLLFFGGRGKSEPLVPGTKPVTFANNDGWHDDTSDGPVRATVTIDGTAMEATPAHVIVAPPNFGPGLFGVVTMDDVVRDLFFQEGTLERPDGTSFSRDIWPIFDRMTGHQWVCDGILLLAGQGTPLDARDPGIIAQLNDATEEGSTYRQAVFNLFRDSNTQALKPAALPPFYGDTYGDRYLDGPQKGELVNPAREDLFLTRTLYQHLQNWADGHFEPDWDGVPTVPNFEDICVADQPRELDRAALHECLGGPFHPGIELTWPMRLASMWDPKVPYRLRPLPEGDAVRQDYGDVLTREQALAWDGPWGPTGPGSLTRWMGVPWQTDEASCNSGLVYTPSLYLSSPSFWGARVPNQVVPIEAYNIATTPDLAPLQVQRHFSNRRFWLRDLQGKGYAERIDNMVHKWWMTGLVEAHTPPEGSGLPDPCFVETGRSRSFTKGDPSLKLAKDVVALQGKEHEVAAMAVRSEPEPEDILEEQSFERLGRGEV